VDAVSWSYASAQATTSGTAFDFGSIPAGVNEIFVGFDEVSMSGTNDILVQIGPAAGVETSGYSSASLSGSTGVAVVASTAAFIVFAVGGTSAYSGVMRLQRGDGNTWHATHNVENGLGSVANGAGAVTLAGELENLRLTRTGSDTFDAGSVIVGWRK